MNSDSLRKEAKMKGLAKAGLSAAAALGITGAGAGGYTMGKKKGKKELAGKFHRYNTEENKVIARRFYNLGRSSSMKKSACDETAILKIAEDTFISQLVDKGINVDSLTKEAKAGVMRAAKSVGKSIVKGMKGAKKVMVAKHKKGIGYGNRVRAGEAMVGEAKKELSRTAKSVAKKMPQAISSAKALGVGAAAGATGKGSQALYNKSRKRK